MLAQDIPSESVKVRLWKSGCRFCLVVLPFGLIILERLCLSAVGYTSKPGVTFANSGGAL